MNQIVSSVTHVYVDST